MISCLWHHCTPLSGIVFLILLLKSAADGTCPHGCRCDVTVVDCRHSNLTYLPLNLPYSSKVRRLLFSGNHIKGVRYELQSYPVLEHLDVSSNNVTYIRDGAFVNVSNIASLILRRNFLLKVTRETFSGLVKLRELDLGYNMLHTIPDGSFHDLKTLHHLDLMKNNISAIESEAFDGLTSLTVLNLTRNYMVSYPTSAFAKLTSLEILILNDNKLQTLPKLAFSNLKRLRSLSLNGNRLISIDQSAFTMTTPNSISQLQDLSLKGTHLAVFPSKAFRNLKNLKTLDLSQNKFTMLSSGSFSGMINLRLLTVNSLEHLRVIENGTFSSLTKLEQLIIRNNKALVSVGGNAFPTSSTLIRLDLSSNSIRYFHKSMANWDTNITVDMRNNKIHCDCFVAWMPFTLHNAISDITKNNALNLTCTSPPLLAGQPIMSLGNTSFKCDVTTDYSQQVVSRVKVAGIAAAVASVVLISCALLIKFRKRICSFFRRQYRYRSYKSNGVFTVHRQNGDLQDEGMPMEVIRSYSDDSDS